MWSSLRLCPRHTKRAKARCGHGLIQSESTVARSVGPGVPGCPRCLVEPEDLLNIGVPIGVPAVSWTCSWSQSPAAASRSSCRLFQFAARTCSRLRKTFNPKVAGSIPARPKWKSLQKSTFPTTLKPHVRRRSTNGVGREDRFDIRADPVIGGGGRVHAPDYAAVPAKASFRFWGQRVDYEPGR
jgi:hypothetical protein